MTRRIPERSLLVVLSLAVVGGCATPSQARGFQGGFSESRIGGTDDEFWIEFEGNAPLDAKTLEQSLLRRAAEVTLERGFTHFVVLGRSHQAGFGFVFRPGMIGPSRQTERAVHIRCSAGHPGVGDAVDAARFLGSLQPQRNAAPQRAL